MLRRCSHTPGRKRHVRGCQPQAFQVGYLHGAGRRRYWAHRRPGCRIRPQKMQFWSARPRSSWPQKPISPSSDRITVTAGRPQGQSSPARAGRSLPTRTFLVRDLHCPAKLWTPRVVPARRAPSGSPFVVPLFVVHADGLLSRPHDRLAGRCANIRHACSNAVLTVVSQLGQRVSGRTHSHIGRGCHPRRIIAA